MKLTPKNWKEFQHYTDRRPAWIKLHRALLDDYQFACLPVASRALAPCLWLLASEYKDGEITASLEEVAFRLRMTKGELSDALHPLVEAKFFTIASEALADCYQDACLEKEREKQVEIEEEKNNSAVANATCATDWPSDYQEIFWEAYPRKVGKKGALRELDRHRKSVSFEKLISAVRAYTATADPQFTKHPKTWLHNGCWDDEPDTRKPNGPTAPNGLASALDKLKQHVGQIERSEEGGYPPPRLLSHG
jgi:hypothetical protein